MFKYEQVEQIDCNLLMNHVMSMPHNIHLQKKILEDFYSDILVNRVHQKI